ncbi:MAG TPA: imidazoleglycerol-phosphate dehydratase HisB [Dongiaceae bacterium]|nr:imidazoleglycerol-phosphate dehydratase HisB [Dongiaceae bacterium]
MRRATVTRNTKETEIRAAVDLDGSGQAAIATGIGFFDHMLEQLARHGIMDIDLSTRGDLHIDGHHTVEDTGLVLGEAIAKALGNRAGIRRWGEAHVPLDEALARVIVDISNRPYLVWKVKFSQPRLGKMDTELFREFFQALAQKAGLTLHVECLYGVNNHHMIEACFKALARALRMAWEIDPRRSGVPSTKGVL